MARVAIKLLKLRRQEKTIVSCSNISPISSRITVLKIIRIMSMLLMVMLLAIFVVKGFYEREKKMKKNLA